MAADIQLRRKKPLSRSEFRVAAGFNEVVRAILRGRRLVMSQRQIQFTRQKRARKRRPRRCVLVERCSAGKPPIDRRR